MSVGIQGYRASLNELSNFKGGFQNPLFQLMIQGFIAPGMDIFGGINYLQGGTQRHSDVPLDDAAQSHLREDGMAFMGGAHILHRNSTLPSLTLERKEFKKQTPSMEDTTKQDAPGVHPLSRIRKGLLDQLVLEDPNLKMRKDVEVGHPEKWPVCATRTLVEGSNALRKYRCDISGDWFKTGWEMLEQRFNVGRMGKCIYLIGGSI
uniref:Uncharacterized protein n=1 Tax=Psilocybe cubensis TaxID=181762 RepID=A0A8H7Y205_PSICU